MAAEDLIVYAIFLFAFGLVVAIVFAGLSFFDAVPIANTNETSPNGNITLRPLQYTHQLIGIFDWIYLFFAVVLAIVLFLSAFLVRSHPAYTVVGFLLMLIWVWVMPNLSNVWITVMRFPVFSGFEAQFPFITIFLVNLVPIGFFVGLIMNVILYGKSQSQGFG